MKIAIRMLQTAPAPERQDYYLQILQVECDREAELINTLLDLQQLEAASYYVSKETINLKDWLPSIIKPFELRTQQRQQSLHIDLPPSLPLLISDRVSLGRVLAELLNNAYKYTPAGGEIVLSVRHNPSKPTITPDSASASIFTISNSAEIPADHLPHIFDKFYRVPNTNPWQQSGTGLGLALVQKLVEQLSGTIQVESVGGWTTFTIQLLTLSVVSS